MKKNILKELIILVISASFLYLSIPTNAQNDIPEVDWFQIIKELDNDEMTEVQTAVNNIWKTWWHTMDTYRREAEHLTPEQQLASWIMNRDTIINYLKYVVKFLSQLWLVVWVVFIMYAWYKYMVSVFTWWKTPSSTIKNAIIWVIIVIFSYAIMRILTSLVWLS